MYDDYFGLKETPFSIAPDPRFLYMSERHREALAHLVYGVGTDGGFVLLSGEVGTGKTTISRCLLEQIPENANIAMVLNPKLIAGELLATICDELKIPYPEGNTSIKVFVDCINRFLLETHAKGRKTVVMIEESQNLSPDVLEQLRLLTNLETHQRKLLQVIMIGQPELLDLLARPELRQLEQRITARYHLMPLSSKDTADYVRHRLAVAGVREPVFSSAVLRKVYKITGGIPRKINLLCDRAMLGAYTKNQKTVDSKILRQAAREIFGEDVAVKQSTSQQNNRSKKYILVGALTASLLLVIAAGMYVNRDVLITKIIPSMVETPALQTKQLSGLQWIDEQLAAFDTAPAYASLYKEWGKEYSQQGADACAFSRSEGLTCLNKTGDIDSLTLLNRPAVVKLNNAAQQAVYVTVTEIDQQSVVLKSGADVYTISLSDLESRWQGEYTLLWRMPPGFNGMIKPGTQGADVNWLANQLASVNGRPQINDEDIIYDAELMKQVKAFQLRAGLVADGVAGEQTLIQLNSAIDKAIPKLVKARQSQSSMQFSRTSVTLGVGNNEFWSVLKVGA